MSRNLSASSELAVKYAVGEVAEFVGVPNYYDAGTSKWLKTGTWVAASYLSSSVKTLIKSSGATKVALATNSLIDESYSYISGVLPSAVVGTTRVVGYSTASQYHTTTACLTINTSSITINATGQASGGYGSNAAGGGNAITSDGTAFWSWSSVSGTAFGARTSTDGLTWSAATLTGQATFSNIDGHQLNMGGSQQYLTSSGETFDCSTTYKNVAAYCGARHLLIGLNGSNQWLAQRSTTGLAWGGDESVAILGSAALAAGRYGWWYRNGNTFYLSLGVASGQRKTTDGGVTWAAATNALVSSATVFHRINSSDAARLAASTASSTAMAFSADSGATWTTRTAPFTLPAVGLYAFYGRGTSWVLCNRSAGLMYKTTDDGANWTQFFIPVGFTNPVQSVCADANRWYMFSAAGNQVATSTDLTTWTVRNISNSAPGTSSAYSPNFIAATDSNTIVGTGGNGSAIASIDGGVTWYWETRSSSTTATGDGSEMYMVANTTGTPCFLSGGTASSNSTASLIATAADVAAGGVAFRATATAVTPLRANSSTYMRAV